MLIEEFWAEVDKQKAGTKRKYEIDVPELYGVKKLTIPVLIKKGHKAGKNVLVTSAVHGDEINHVNTCHRIYKSHNFEVNKGMLIIIPVVNIYGYINKSRYFPDRRDLNRSFPGSANGSLASQIAYLITEYFLKKVDYLVDLHTAAIGRFNTPQVRCNLNDPEIKPIAKKLYVPLILNSPNRDGSLRNEAANLDIPAFVFEAGEALRQNNHITAATMRFLKSFLATVGLMDKRPKSKSNTNGPIMIDKSVWVRASESGLLVSKSKEGKVLRKKQIMAEIRTIRGDIADKIYCKADGVILGETVNPLIIKGDAIFHLGYIKSDEVDTLSETDWFDEDVENYYT